MNVRPLLRLPDVKAALGLGTTVVYAQINQRLITPPVKLTPKTSAWPEAEIEAIQRAIIAGKSETERRKLVAELVAARTSSVPVQAIAKQP